MARHRALSVGCVKESPGGKLGEILRLDNDGDSLKVEASVDKRKCARKCPGIECVVAAE